MSNSYQIKTVHEDEWDVRYKGVTIGSIRRGRPLYSRSGIKTLYVHDNRGNERRVADIKNQNHAKLKLDAFFSLLESEITETTNERDKVAHDLTLVTADASKNVLTNVLAQLNIELADHLKFRLETLRENGGAK